MGQVRMDLDGFANVSAALRSGVYALCAKGSVIYVGKSRSMIGRINAHRKAWVDKRQGKAHSWITDRLGIPGLLFDEVHIRPCRLEELDALEVEMINRYKPKYNIQLKTDQKIKAQVNLTINGFVIPLNPKLEAIERRL